MHLRDWLTRLPITDPVQQRQSRFFQIVLIAWIALASIGLPLNVLRGPGEAPSDILPSEALPLVFFILLPLLALAGVMLWLTPVIALVLLRRGKFGSAVYMAAWGLLLGHSIATLALGVADPSVYLLYQIPIALAALLGGSRMLLLVSGYSIGFVLLVALLQLRNPPLAGFFSPLIIDATGATALPAVLGQSIFFFVTVTLLNSILLDRFGNTLRESLRESLQRETELQAIRASLESIVGERTAALEAALNDAQQRSTVQMQLLDELEQQREVIRELSIPVLPISRHTLIMPLVGTLDTERLMQIQEQALSRIAANRSRRLLLDITGVPVVDSQVAQGLIRVVHAARLLGAEVDLVGIRPEVAQSIVGLGLDLRNIRTHSNLEGALMRTGASS